MRGNIKYQVSQIVKEMNGKGESRHADKANARENGAKGSHNIAKETKIHSISYEKSIRSTAKGFLEFQGDNFLGSRGKADIEKINQEQVRAYLDDRMCNLSREKFDVICSHMARIETALESRTGQQYNLYETIQEERHLGKAIMPETERPSRYQSSDNRDRIIENISNEKFHFGAQFMKESGTRIREASNIEHDVIDKHGNWHGLRGTHADPMTGEEKGYTEVQGKGGKWRTVEMSVETYRELERRINESDDNRFEMSKTSFSRAYSQAADKADVETDGTHDLRHSWYQDRVMELVEAGVDFDHAVEIADNELGHGRCMWDVYGR